MEKRTTAQEVLNVVDEPLGKAGYGHRPMMLYWSEEPDGMREALEGWARQVAPLVEELRERSRRTGAAR